MLLQLFLSGDCCPCTCLPSAFVSVTAPMVPFATVTFAGSPGATSPAPEAGVSATAAGFTGVAGASVGPPPAVPPAFTLEPPLLHAPSVSAAIKPSTATPQFPAACEVSDCHTDPQSPLGTPNTQTSRDGFTFTGNGVTSITLHRVTITEPARPTAHCVSPKCAGCTGSE